MTREEARKAAEVMLAYAEGKDIEYLKYGNYSWNTISAEKGEVAAFDWHNYDYRIKQSLTCRPFNTLEGC